MGSSSARHESPLLSLDIPLQHDDHLGHGIFLVDRSPGSMACSIIYHWLKSIPLTIFPVTFHLRCLFAFPSAARGPYL